jgi:hypothetical protein
MIVVSTAYIYPVCQSIVQMKEDGIPLEERLNEFPWAFSDLLFPFMMEYLLSWYVIWECVVSYSLMHSPRDSTLFLEIPSQAPPSHCVFSFLR